MGIFDIFKKKKKLPDVVEIVRSGIKMPKAKYASMKISSE
jgi:hypothetical protein